MGRKSTKGKEKPVHVGCELSKTLYDRLEALRGLVPRAAIIQKAIEEYLDREAPLKAKTARG